MHSTLHPQALTKPTDSTNNQNQTLDNLNNKTKPTPKSTNHQTQIEIPTNPNQQTNKQSNTNIHQLPSIQAKQQIVPTNNIIKAK